MMTSASEEIKTVKPTANLLRLKEKHRNKKAAMFIARVTHDKNRKRYRVG